MDWKDEWNQEKLNQRWCTPLKTFPPKNKLAVGFEFDASNYKSGYTVGIRYISHDDESIKEIMTNDMKEIRENIKVKEQIKSLSSKFKIDDNNLYGWLLYKSITVDLFERIVNNGEHNVLNELISHFKELILFLDKVRDETSHAK